MAKDNYKLRILGGESDEDTLKNSIRRILDTTPLLAFATVDRSSGKPHISNSYFGYSSSLQIITLTSPESNHSKNIKHNPDVAINVTNTMQLPSAKKSGLELIGKMRRARGLEATKAYANYFKHMMLFMGQKPKKSDSGGGTSLSKMMTSRPYVVDVDIVKVYDEKNLPPDTTCVAEVKR